MATEVSAEAAAWEEDWEAVPAKALGDLEAEAANSAEKEAWDEEANHAADQAAKPERDLEVSEAAAALGPRCVAA